MHMHTQGVGNIASPSCSTFRSSWQNCMSWEHLRLPRGLYRMYMQLIARLDHGYLTQLSPKVISCPHLTFKVRWRPPLTYFMWRVTTDRLKTADAKDEAKRGQLKRATERSQSPAPEAGSLDLRWDGWRAGRGPRIFSVSFENQEFAFASAGTRQAMQANTTVPPQHRGRHTIPLVPGKRSCQQGLAYEVKSAGSASRGVVPPGSRGLTVTDWGTFLVTALPDFKPMSQLPHTQRIAQSLLLDPPSSSKPVYVKWSATSPKHWSGSSRIFQLSGDIGVKLIWNCKASLCVEDSNAFERKKAMRQGLALSTRSTIAAWISA